LLSSSNAPPLVELASVALTQQLVFDCAASGSSALIWNNKSVALTQPAANSDCRSKQLADALRKPK
jgi:hypothetical protein